MAMLVAVALALGWGPAASPAQAKPPKSAAAKKTGAARPSKAGKDANPSKANPSKAKDGKSNKAKDSKASKAATGGKSTKDGAGPAAKGAKIKGDDADNVPSAKQKKAQAKQRDALKKECEDKKAAKTKKCKAFAKQEDERQASDEAAKLDDLCKDKAEKKTKKCKAHLAKRSKPESDPCGRKYGRARKAESLAKFAKRYGVAEDRIRELNDLGAKTKKLKAGKRLLIAKSPHDGVVLAGGEAMPDDDPNYRLRRPFNAYGKPLMVATLRLAASQVQLSSPLLPKLVIGDLSKEGGGCLPPHKSHRGGLDVDIGYYFRGAYESQRLADATGDTLDADRTWQFLRALLATSLIQYAFVHYKLQPALHEAALRAGESEASAAKLLQYPRPAQDKLHTPIRHLDGHDDHMHVRMTCEGDDCQLSDEARQRMAAVQLETLGGPRDERRRHGALSPLLPALPK